MVSTPSLFFVRPCERNAREKKMPTRARVTEGKRRERILQRARATPQTMKNIGRSVKYHNIL